MSAAPNGTPERVVAGKRAEEDAAEMALRPQTLDEFIGQKQVRENLKIFIAAARARKEALDHVLFHGPPGLGKTTLAQIVAREMGVGFRATSGPVIQKAGDLAAQLTNLQPHDVLFIDEIHRLQKTIEEYLYPAMEDFKLDIIIDQGPNARSVRLNLPRFTLIGATTRSGLLSSPLLTRFGMRERLDYYVVEDMEKIVERSANLLNVEIEKTGAHEVARRSRGTPRIANRLLRRVRDFAQVRGNGVVDEQAAKDGLRVFGVDEGRGAAALLRFCNHVEGQRGLARRLGAADAAPDGAALHVYFRAGELCGGYGFQGGAHDVPVVLPFERACAGSGGHVRGGDVRRFDYRRGDVEQ